MSSRQFTPFGGTGEIVTLDNINERHDLPPLAEIDSPDVYEIRTGELGTDYLVPMQDGSTDFNEWYSLVDGQIIVDIPDSVVDNFNDADADPPGVYGADEDVDDYYTFRDTSSTYIFRQTDTVFEGSHALEVSVTGDAGVLSFPGDGLNSYPQKGDIFQSYFYNPSSGGARRPAIIYGGQDTDNYYQFANRDDDNEIRFRPIKDGSANNVGTTSATIPTDEWYVMRVEWHDGSGSESEDTHIGQIWSIDGNGDLDSMIAETTMTDSDFAGARGAGIGANSDDDGVDAYADNYEKVGEVGE